MIRTSNQLRQTKRKIAEFERSLQEINDNRAQMEPKDYQLQHDSLCYLLRKMKEEISEYELIALSDHDTVTLDFEVEDLPRMLIKARLVRRMSQSDLARSIGVEPQQIQRYETNGYSGVSFDRLMEIKKALDFPCSCSATLHQRISVRSESAIADQKLN